MRQLDHYETLKKMPRCVVDCVLYACDVSLENLGLILRSADIFGVSKVYYCDDSQGVKSKQLLRLSRNSHIPLLFSNGIDILLSLKNDGYQIVALEITDVSVPLRLGTFQEKTCLVVGNEKSGVPDDVLSVANCSYHIEMIGNNISSLNVSVATSIALYEMAQYRLNTQVV